MARKQEYKCFGSASNEQPPAPKSAKSLAGALGKGVGNCCSEKQRDLTTHAADAGAMPRMACCLVIGEGFGDPRQRT